jgi:hypothetical protein
VIPAVIVVCNGTRGLFRSVESKRKNKVLSNDNRDIRGRGHSGVIPLVEADGDGEEREWNM